MSLFSRLLGLFFHPASAEPAKSLTVPSANEKMLVETKPETRIFIGWAEMIDRQAGIAGYKLAPRPLKAGDPISGPLLASTLEREGISRFGERRPIIVPLTCAQWNTADFKPLITKQTVFQIINPDHSSSVDIQEFFSVLQASGSHVALSASDFFGQDWADRIPDFLIYDFRSASLPIVEEQIKDLRRVNPALMLVAEGVDSWTEHRLAQSMGFAFSIGEFATTKDEDRQPEPLSGSRVVILELLNKLRAEVSPALIVSTAKHDPAIVLKLLKMANSPIYGLGRQINSLEEAVVILGRDTLYRWLAIALFKLGSNSGLDQTLLVLALGRARFLESIAKNGAKQLKDELFLVGLLSVIDKLLGESMLKIIGQMTLPAAVGSALMNMEGPYARFLLLAMDMERCRLDQAVILASALDIPPSHLIQCYSEALEWATSELLDT